jgi:hypothetical protein
MMTVIVLVTATDTLRASLHLLSHDFGDGA